MRTIFSLVVLMSGPPVLGQMNTGEISGNVQDLSRTVLPGAFSPSAHPNFNIPNRTAFTANFGTISSAQDSRQLQFALKLAF